MPSGRTPSLGIPSGRDRLSAGMLNRTQWVKFPMGVSVSSAINAKLFVPSGGSLHERGGEMFRPVQVYRSGILSPSAKAGLVSWIPAMCPQMHGLISILSRKGSGTRKKIDMPSGAANPERRTGWQGSRGSSAEGR